MPKTLAIVDDELEMEDVFSLIFEELTSQDLLRIEFFSDAPALWKWTETRRPDLVITDISLSGIEGPELVRGLRQRAPEIPVYFMSGHAEESYRKLMRELNVCRYLAKPFAATALLAFVEHDLGLIPVGREEMHPPTS